MAANVINDKDLSRFIAKILMCKTDGNKFFEIMENIREKEKRDK